MKTTHTILLVLAAVGVALFLTQKLWFPLVGPSIEAKEEIKSVVVNEEDIVSENHENVDTVTPIETKKDVLKVSISGRTASIAGPVLAMNRIEKCVVSVGWYGYGGNGLSIDWGDGSESGDFTGEEGTSCASEQRTHTYVSAGTYRVHVRAWHPGPTDAPITDWEGSTTVTVL